MLICLQLFKTTSKCHNNPSWLVWFKFILELDRGKVWILTPPRQFWMSRFSDDCTRISNSLWLLESTFLCWKGLRNMSDQNHARLYIPELVYVQVFAQPVQGECHWYLPHNIYVFNSNELRIYKVVLLFATRFFDIHQKRFLMLSLGRPSVKPVFFSQKALS